MKINEQYRMIRDPKDIEAAQVPTMPILVFLNNGIVGEASTIRGAVAIIAGNYYFDCEDAVDEWNLRVEVARKACMNALSKDIYAVVYDKNIGIVRENYAADPEGEDYKVDETEAPEKIHVENDRNFLLSLARIEAVTILQRAGSNLLTKWKNGVQSCNDCAYCKESDKGNKCEVYNMLIKKDEGEGCFSYYNKLTKESEGSTHEYYNIAEEVDLTELIESN